MNYRNIILYAGSSGFGSGFGEEFDNKFNYNTWFISNYLSLQIRKLHYPSCGNFNMVYCNITAGNWSVKVESTSVLNVKVHLDDKDIHNYLEMTTEIERFEFYLSILEKGYRQASLYCDIPSEVFLKLHQKFRSNMYKNERLFKKKQVKDYGIKIELRHKLTTYNYNLMIFIYNLQGNLIGEGSVYETFPDDIFFNKTIRHLVIENGELIITDFLNHPQFVCQLEDLARGIVKAECVDELTKKYIPNENNKEEFERLKW